MKRTPLKSDPEKAHRWSRPRPISQASPQQKRAMAEQRCVVCGLDMIDAAHLISRAMCPEGADEPLAVIPLCRTHHRDFDEGRLDLLPYLELGDRLELAYAVQRFGLLSTLERVTNTHWQETPR